MRRRTLKTVLHTPRKRRIPMVIALIYVSKILTEQHPAFIMDWR